MKLGKFLSRKFLATVGVVATDFLTTGQISWRSVAATGVYVVAESALDAIGIKHGAGK